MQNITSYPQRQPRRPAPLHGFRGMLRILPGRASRARGSVCFAHRRPRAARRGLGLFDAILAAAVLSFMLLWGGQIVGDWARDRVVTGEARTVSDLARAGRLLLEGDVTHAGRSHPVGVAPLPVTLAELETAGLRAAGSPTRTPGRRTLSLWLWRPDVNGDGTTDDADNDLVVIARARGSRPLSRLPYSIHTFPAIPYPSWIDLN